MPFNCRKHHLNVRLIDYKVLSSIYLAMNSSFFSSVMAVFDKGQPLVYTFMPSFIPNMILLKGFHIHVSQLTNLESRLVTMSVSLCTQTVLCCLTM